MRLTPPDLLPVHWAYRIDWLRDGAHVPKLTCGLTKFPPGTVRPLVLHGLAGVARRTYRHHSLDLVDRTVVPPGDYEVYCRLGVVFEEVPV